MAGLADKVLYHLGGMISYSLFCSLHNSWVSLPSPSSPYVRSVVATRGKVLAKMAARASLSTRKLLCIRKLHWILTRSAQIYGLLVIHHRWSGCRLLHHSAPDRPGFHEDHTRNHTAAISRHHCRIRCLLVDRALLLWSVSSY